MHDGGISLRHLKLSAGGHLLHNQPTGLKHLILCPPFDCTVVDCVKIPGFTNILNGGGTLGTPLLSNVSPCADSSFFDDGLGPYWDGIFDIHNTAGDGCRWEFGHSFGGATVWYSTADDGGDPAEPRKWMMSGFVEYNILNAQWQMHIRFEGATFSATAVWVRAGTEADGPYGAFSFDNALSTANAFDNVGCPLNVPTLTIGPC